MAWQVNSSQYWQRRSDFSFQRIISSGGHLDATFQKAAWEKAVTLMRHDERILREVIRASALFLIRASPDVMQRL